MAKQKTEALAEHKKCPMQLSSAAHGFKCLGCSCAWWDREMGQCAVLSIASWLAFMSSFSEDGRIDGNVHHVEP